MGEKRGEKSEAKVGQKQCMKRYIRFRGLRIETVQYFINTVHTFMTPVV
jgi:hypothetical protein